MDSDTRSVILAVYQKHIQDTIISSIWAFLERGFRNYSSLIVIGGLTQKDSSLGNLSSITQLKVLELHLEAVAVSTQRAVKGALNGGETTRSTQQKQHRRVFFFYSKEGECSATAESIARLKPIEDAFHMLKTETEGRKTHKQAATEGSGGKSQAKHHEGGNPAKMMAKGSRLQAAPCKGLSTKY